MPGAVKVEGLISYNEDGTRSLGITGENEIPVKVYGLARATKRILGSTVYNANTIFRVEIIFLGTGNVRLSPLSGDADITITNAEMTAWGVALYSKVFDGPFDEVVTTGTTELLVHIA